MAFVTEQQIQKVSEQIQELHLGRQACVPSTGNGAEFVKGTNLIA